GGGGIEKCHRDRYSLTGAGDPKHRFSVFSFNTEDLVMFSLRRIGFAAMVALGLTACGAEGGTGSDEGAETEVKPPPQVVILAFDGSLNLDFWKESRAFAQSANVKWTYFISGVYFLADTKKSLYQGPHHSVGGSDIGFGGPATDIPLRVEQLQLASQEGHEI